MRDTREAAEGLGIKSYDTALPETWVAKVRSRASYLFRGDLKSPVGHVVWCYDNFPDGTMNLGGYPVAVTPEGRAILGALAASI